MREAGIENTKSRRFFGLLSLGGKKRSSERACGGANHSSAIHHMVT
jgi:hypothetical protein